MDETGDSYGDINRRSGDAISAQQVSKWLTKPIVEFPKPRTLGALADLLQVPVTTIILAFAVSLGLPVRQAGTTLEVTLPPGTDVLTPEDRAAIRGVTAALVDARRQSLRPDLEKVQGLRLAEEPPAGRATFRNDAD